jgi:Tfp pilus assembly protein PilF
MARFAVFICALALALAPALLPAAPLWAAERIAPKSQELTRQGLNALANKQATAALGFFETAVAVDPRNDAAYLAMARAYEMLGLPGKALRYYRQALSVNPSNVAALEGQTQGFLAKNLTEQARANIARLRQICSTSCGNVIKRLEEALVQQNAKAATQTSSTLPGAAKPSN